MLAGKKDGGWSAPEKLLDKAGNVLRLSQYWDDKADKWTDVKDSKLPGKLGVGAAAVDWDDDGDLDLVLGSNTGHFFLRTNEGTKQKHAFATESVQLMSGTAPLATGGGDTIPQVVDWDGDGLFDILSGGSKGGVAWFRNTGKKGAPAFAPSEILIASKSAGAASPEPAWPGERTQVHATDFDGDGDLDVLVGDHNSAPYVEGKRPEMHGWVWLFRRQSSAR